MQLFTILTTAIAITAGVANAAFNDLPAGAKIPNQYIIVYKETAQPASIANHESWLQAATAGGSAELVRRGVNATGLPTIPTFGAFNFVHKYSGAGAKFRGYAAKISDAIAETLKTLPDIALVEQDTVVKTLATQSNPPSWGLKRISTASLPLPSTYTYPDVAGSGIQVYIVDTGIDVSHPNFEGRAVWAGNYAGDGQNSDGNGHGTHVAGTVGSALYGVAKSVTLHAVKVLDASGSGTNSGVIAGVNFVAGKGASGKVNGVANMSLGGGVSTALDSAVSAAIANGIAFAVAAGNEASNACNVSPARVPTALTVAASDSTDKLASFSNFGSCVDIIAPGVSITSTWLSKGTNTISGTSMAAPHAAGVLALLLSQKSYTTVASLFTDILAITAKNKITSVAGSPNLLLQVPSSTAPTTSVVITPTATSTATTTTTTAVPTTTTIACAHSYCVTGSALLGQSSASDFVRPSLPRFEGFGFLQRYEGVRGYAAKMPKEVAEVLKTLPEVLLVEQDSVMKTAAVQSNPPAWGLRRISTADLPLPANFQYPDSAGAGVHVYIIDTGIDIKHSQFGGRAVWDANFADFSDSDGYGHGTHVAGTVGAILYGVAKNTTLHAVKVLSSNGSGTTSGVIAGVDYVAQKATSGNVTAIANMSLGGDASDALDASIAAAVSAGVAVVVAAGNQARDACLVSPARAPTAFTVAASDRLDQLADFSNYGSCVDVIAPGVNIASTWPGNSSNTISGTSMAAPHAAGVMALLLGAKSYSSVEELTAATLSIISKNRVKLVPADTVNLLIQVPGAGGADSPVPTPPPSPPKPSGCTHGLCIRGGPLTCNDPCVQAIIKVDPYCGEFAWDATCIEKVKTVCNITC
ncbi:subtilisin-like serine protease [Dinochytrium kinnereticum]|nr:subtilisin-like serine protease [Dinochytrium kinnereticum]